MVTQPPPALPDMRQVSQRPTEATIAGLAELARWALDAATPDTVTDNALGLVCRVLGVEHVELLRPVAGERVLRVAAGRGWRERLTPNAQPIEGGTPLDRLAVLVGKPLSVVDWRTERRFAQPERLRKHLIRSSVLVACRGAGDHQAPDVLAAHSVAAYAFSADQVLFLETVGALVGDAVARQRAEVDAARTAAELRTILETTSDIVLRVGTDLRIAGMNGAAEQAIGLRADQTPGRTLRECGVGDEDVALLESALSRALAGGQEQVLEHGLTTVGGRRSFRTRLVPQARSDALEGCVLAILTDVTVSDERSKMASLLAQLLDGQRVLLARLEHLAGQSSAERQVDAIRQQLTGREREIMRLVGMGWSNAEIAQQLTLSSGTVKNHLIRIFRKLHVHSRLQAAIEAGAFSLRKGTPQQISE